MCTLELVLLLRTDGRLLVGDELLANGPPDPNPPIIIPPKLPLGTPSTTVLDPITRLPPEPRDTKVPPKVVPETPGDNVAVPEAVIAGPPGVKGLHHQ